MENNNEEYDVVGNKVTPLEGVAEGPTAVTAAGSAIEGATNDSFAVTVIK